MIVLTLFAPGASLASRSSDSYPPPVDSHFMPKQLLGHSRTTYIPIIRSSPAQTDTLHLVYLQDYQHIAYRISRDNGATWSPPADQFPDYIANELRWGGSIGNLDATVDKSGKFTVCWFQLYGFAYPGIRCRSRTPDQFGSDGTITSGQWQPETAVPGSDFERMKVVQVTSDQYGDLHLLVGKGKQTLYYSATDGHDQWNPLSAMPIVPASLPNPTFLPDIVVLKGGTGALLTAWGDARGISGQGGDTWQIMTAYARPTADGAASWQTYYFTDTDASGNYLAGAGQYDPKMAVVDDGRVGLFFTCRPKADDAAADVCYREWSASLAEQGVRMGWLTDTITVAATAPPDSQAQAIAVDPTNHQIYVCWQDGWDNLEVTCSHSADGVHWHAPYLVNSGLHTREKMIGVAITHDLVSSWLHIVWADNYQSGLGIYYTQAPAPALYPQPTPTPTTP